MTHIEFLRSESWRAPARRLAAALLLSTIAGCGGGYGGGGGTGAGGSYGGMATGPVITVQPASQSVAAGATATFSVTATGTPPLAYQWMGNGTAIGGATASSYTTPATTAADNGTSFTVKVSNAYGSVTSNAAMLTVM